MVLNTAEPGSEESGIVSYERVKIYTGVLGQIGDIIMFSATVRRLKELFPRSEITFAVSRKYQEAGELLMGLPYVDRLFVTELYFEKLTPRNSAAWELGWPVDLRGEDEVREQAAHDLVLETRPRHRRRPWWDYAHLVEECAHKVGVPGPMDRRTEIVIPAGTTAPPEAQGKIVLHNDPAIDLTKGWSWEHVQEFVRHFPPQTVVLIGNPGHPVGGVVDLRGQLSLSQSAATIASCRCFVGIDSGPMWIAGSLQVPVVGMYGTSYIAAYDRLYPENPRAKYLQVEGPPTIIPPEQVLASVRDRLATTP